MSKSKRKFHKTVITVTVLSEEQFEWDNLEDIAYAISAGDCSGEVKETSHKVITAKQTASELQSQGSDPEFFQIDEDGNELS